MFDTDLFVEECLAAYRGLAPQAAIKEVVERAAADPAAIAKRLGPFDSGGIQVLHHSAEMTILNIVWPSYMSLFPHNHTNGCFYTPTSGFSTSWQEPQVPWYCF